MSYYSIRPLAEQELDDYVAYIAKDNIDAALRLYEAAEETYEQLAEFPKIGEYYPSTNPLLFNVRYFPITGFKNYLVFYQCRENHVEIIRVINKSKNIRQILG